MPHHKLDQAILLFAAIIGVAAAIAFACSRTESPQRKAMEVGQQTEANSTQEIPANESKKPISVRASHAIAERGNSQNNVGESVPGVVEHKRSETERATEAFHQSHQCHVAWNTIKGLQSEIAGCDSLGSAMDDICRRNIKQAQRRIQVQTARLAGCSTVPAVLEKAYFDSVSRAAELGNSDAQVCYVQGDFYNEMGRQELEQYKDNARNYIQLGLVRGDWRIVSLLATHHVDHIGRLGELELDNPYDVLRMNRLLRDGATGEYAQQLDWHAQDSAVSLSKTQIDSAIAWARQEYEQYFRNSPILHSDPEGCQEVELYKETADQ